jgi:hypothetical protein
MVRSGTPLQIRQLSLDNAPGLKIVSGAPQAGGPTVVCFPFRQGFGWKSASGWTAAFKSIQTGRIPKEGLGK